MASTTPPSSASTILFGNSEILPCHVWSFCNRKKKSKNSEAEISYTKSLFIESPW